MELILHSLLTWLLLYGYPVVILCVVLAYLFLPVPLNVLLVAAGAFTSEGTMSISVLIPLFAVCASGGDILQYLVARALGNAVFSSVRFQTLGISSRRLESGVQFVEKWGSSSIFLTRWLITPLGAVVNLAAGVHRYPFRKFLFFVVAGEMLWSVLYVSLGVYLGSNWVSIMEYINDAPTLLAALTLGFASTLVGVRLLKKRRREV